MVIDYILITLLFLATIAAGVSLWLQRQIKGKYVEVEILSEIRKTSAGWEILSFSMFEKHNIFWKQYQDVIFSYLVNIALQNALLTNSLYNVIHSIATYLYAQILQSNKLGNFTVTNLAFDGVLIASPSAYIAFENAMSAKYPEPVSRVRNNLSVMEYHPNHRQSRASVEIKATILSHRGAVWLNESQTIHSSKRYFYDNEDRFSEYKENQDGPRIFLRGSGFIPSHAYVNTSKNFQVSLRKIDQYKRRELGNLVVWSHIFRSERGWDLKKMHKLIKPEPLYLNREYLNIREKGCENIQFSGAIKDVYSFLEFALVAVGFQVSEDTCQRVSLDSDSLQYFWNCHFEKPGEQNYGILVRGLDISGKKNNIQQISRSVKVTRSFNLDDKHIQRFDLVVRSVFWLASFVVTLIAILNGLGIL